MSKQQKILILVDWFLPGYKAGGPIQSCANIAFALKEKFEVAVVTTDTDHGELAPYNGIIAGQWLYNIDSKIAVKYLQKKRLSPQQLKTALLEAKGDYIYLNHFFSPYFVIYPLWLAYQKKLKGKIVLCPRGALFDSALAVKSLKKKIFLRLLQIININKFVKFHATNEREKDAIEHYFPGSEIVVADNLPATTQPLYKTLLKENGSLKCIFIARIVPIKNLDFFLNALQNVQNRVELTIVGPIENKSYWETCQKKIALLPTYVSVLYAGPKENKELAALIQQHHLFVLPTQGENFGHSIFESFIAGRPVLISDQTPWRNLADKKVGWDLSLNNTQNFANAIDEAASWNQQVFDQLGANAWKYASDFINHPLLVEPYSRLFS
jgi:glycosyltransferase involved in cell wall biosynthesis